MDKVTKKKVNTNNVLPTDVKNVYIDKTNKSVTVELTDGHKGVSVAMPNDEFDPYVGFCIAYFRSRNKKSFELKQAFNGAITHAEKMKYKTAILKNDNTKYNSKVAGVSKSLPFSSGTVGVYDSIKNIVNWVPVESTLAHN